MAYRHFCSRAVSSLPNLCELTSILAIGHSLGRWHSRPQLSWWKKQTHSLWTSMSGDHAPPDNPWKKNKTKKDEVRKKCFRKRERACSRERGGGLFTNYVDKNLSFFYHAPPSVYIFYYMNVDKNRYFLTIYPLVNVVYERPLGWTHFFSTKNFTTIAKQSCAIARRLQAWSQFTTWISGLALL